MDFTEAQRQFLVLANGISNESATAFFKWVVCVSEDTLKSIEPSPADQLINSLRQDIKSSLPLSAVVQSENILFPRVGENADCDPKSTVHVDGFLYDEDEIDELCDEGQMSRNYCLKCGSHEVQPLTFISHSSSVTQLKFIFQYLLPRQTLDNSVILDIGSRLGAVLYGAAIYSGAERLRVVGVEMNEELCRLQSTMIAKYQLHKYAAIEVVCSDITNCTDVVHSADVIIMNNIFDFFVPLDVQTSVWKFLRQHIKPGARLVLTPTIEQSLEHLNTDIDISSWMVRIDTEAEMSKANLHLFGSETSEDSDLADIYLYRTIEQTASK